MFLCTVIGVTDGDTFRIRCPVWPGIVAEDSLRVRGIDTPEKGHRAACDAERKKSDEATALAKDVREVTISNIARDKYGRLLADVYVGDRLWSDVLISKKLAIPYDGGTKTNPWCK